MRAGTTDYHAKYYAHMLGLRSPSDSLAKLGSSLLNATVDLNPHQIDAALFAFRSPLSRGALLADEVGLGKTIEAGLVVAQLWAERRRHILAIVPTTLRSQWVQELADKFFIPARAVDTSTLKASLDAGEAHPFTSADGVVVCSYNFARAHAAVMARVSWDLVIVDEAHRLRNVYKPQNKIARELRDALRGKPKLLLTATPLQNSLLELFGLVSFLDDHLFGDMPAFRAAYLRGPLSESLFRDLRHRLAPVCKRTLRRQVVEYVRYTRRIPITQDFTPTDEEQRLYDAVSTYLLRDNLHALPSGQRKLMTLVLRRLLASSSFAIAGTLETLVQRLRGEVARLDAETAAELLAQDFEALPEMSDEWAEGDGEPDDRDDGATRERAEVEAEIDELAGFKDLATSITRNAKGQALLTALASGFDKLATLGAARKAVIFTESRRTQEYLVVLLEANGYAGQVMTLNGTNTDGRSSAIFSSWRAAHADTERATGNRSVDLRAALVDHFRESASILVATEAAAEGVNLQFCSLVVNYDLPWNPQRVEQRIGRCHRYGQKHDVVVINFLNRRNEADQRVFTILSEKFKLFDGVFGASDEVLGALESGVDFERRIASIYQSCRTPEEIDRAFDALQADLSQQIQAQLLTTRAQLLENFDEEVHERLRVHQRDTQTHLDRLSRALWALTRHELGGLATFDDGTHSFELAAAPGQRYVMLTPGRATAADHVYRLGHPLAQEIRERAAARELPTGGLVFQYSGRPTRLALVERLVGERGHLALHRVEVTALEREEHLLLSGATDAGIPLDAETLERLMLVDATAAPWAAPSPAVEQLLTDQYAQLRGGLLERLEARNRRFFEDEMEKLERWADDLKAGVEQEIKDLDQEIRAAKRDARLQASLDAKVAAQRRIKELESQRNAKRRALFEAQDEIESRKENLLAEIEARLAQSVSETRLFTIRFEVA